MKFESVWFDLDGTLMDTIADILGAFVATFKEYGIAAEKESIAIGPPLREIIKGVLPNATKEEMDRIVVSFGKNYDSSNFIETSIYPGIENLLDSLKDKKVPMFIITNKRLTPTLEILKKFKWEKFFEGVYSIDSFEPILPKGKNLKLAIAKHGVNLKKAVIIGDTAGDIIAGDFVEMSTVGVTWGYGSRESMEKESPDYLIDKVKELNSILL